MNNWKVISQIAALSGIVFIIFAALTAFINYQIIALSPSFSFAPSNIIQISILSAMLPFLMLAIVSFVVAAIGSRAAKETPENEHTHTHVHPPAAETPV